MSFKYNPSKTKGNLKFSKSCWHSHPVYVLKCEDGEYSIVGGSCTSAYPENVDVFIGFDSGMAQGNRSYPWIDGHDVFFHIQDRGVPKSTKDFKKLIDWTAEQLRNKKRVFAGCIGGHGRTGLFLSALTKVMTGEEDAITVVRENYCKKAVESTNQVLWLVKHFGIKTVSGSDSSTGSKGSKGGSLIDWDSWNSSYKESVSDISSHKYYTEDYDIKDGLVSEEPKTKFHPMSGHSEFSNNKDLDKDN